MDSNTFTDNTASVGGAVRWTVMEPVSIEAQTYSGNTATVYGAKYGAVP